jgi:peptide subunit release factor 1 (eRF1)
LEATAEFKRQLPKALQDRVIMADLPLSAQATPSEVSEAAMAFLKPIERINEQRLVAQLAEQRGLGQAVFGLSAVIKAILEQRADLLVFSAQVQFSGGHCPRCAFMASEPLPQACPLCGTLFQRDHDLVEYLIKRVREQGGHIEELHEEAAAVLGANGGIATRLRYTIPPIGRSRYYGEKNQVFQTGPPARH